MVVFIVLGILIIAGFFAAAVVTLILQEGRVEIDPMQAVVVKNIWTGEASALTQGMHFIIPGISKRLVDVTLKNEPSDPPPAHVSTADGTELGVDYVIYTQQVQNDPAAIVNAATKIDYAKRNEFIKARIEADLESAFIAHNFADIWKDALNKTTLQQIQEGVNDELERQTTTQWGINVEIRIQDIDFPSKFQEAAADEATAEKEGSAIKKKAEAAGVPPTIIAVGDIITDFFETFNRKGQK